MSCFTSSLKFISRFISEFFRLILFFASLIFVLVTVLLLLSSAQNRNIYRLIEIKESDSYFFAIIGLACYLICLALCGVYASFFRSRTSMEWFSLLAGLNVIIVIGVFMYVTPRLDDSKTEISMNLQDMQPNYNWTSNSTSGAEDKKTTATKTWDEIQKNALCCGLESAADWNKFKPMDLPEGSLPASCCVERKQAEDNKNICDSSRMKYWELGCVKQIVYINSAITILLTALIWFNILLGLMACVVLLCGPSRAEYQSYN